jgi:uncharacterized membrane protein
MSLDGGIGPLTLVAGFGSALVSGVFFAFSTFVMAGLGKVEPAPGIRAMQGINEAAITPAFMVLLFGTAIAAVAVGALALAAGSLGGSGWLYTGLVIYILGIVVVTGAGNVPMNDALAEVSASEPGAQTYWSTYLSRWTLLNHVRTVTSAAAAVAFFVGYLAA